jgi:hypothetical protein
MHGKAPARRESGHQLVRCLVISTTVTFDRRRHFRGPQNTGVTCMCDYSLQHVATRPAKVGDRLVSTKFVNSITRGFAEIGAPNVAVCILPGTELVFDKDVECDHVLGFFPSRKLRANLARFRQINLDNPHEHHDALEFPNGQVVLLTRLCEGQKATVLQLPAMPAEQEGEAPQVEARRVTFVE